MQRSITGSRTNRRRVALTAALAALGALSLADCTPGVKPAPAAMSDSPALPGYYEQKLAWSRCGELECAALTVPMDYAHPDSGKTFVLPLVKAAATDPAHRIGSLVFDPGGPGASGVATLKGGGADSFGTAARTHFDIVGFDPRGVAGSRPAVDCTPPDDSAGTTTDAAPPLYPTTDAERQAVLADADRSAAACQSRSGELLPHVGTLDAARDLDVLRAALGDDRLTYLGWSYGTYLGTVYAEQFPRRVRALVLDGAVDPSLDWSERALRQARAFQRAVDDYADRCASVAKEACPAATPQGIRTLISDLDARTARHPLPIKGSTRRLDQSMLNTALTNSMYAPESQWKDLSEALSAARGGDGGKLAAIADHGLDLQNDGSGGPNSSDSPGPSNSSGSSAPSAPADEPRDNSADVLSAVNCLDVPHPRDPQAYWDVLDRAHRESGAFGASNVLAELDCRQWPAGPQQPHRVKADGVPPVLVVGTTGDAATPFEEARSLAAQLPGGMLLTYRGVGHTAYGRSNSCITDAVDAYLLDLKPVSSGASC